MSKNLKNTACFKMQNSNSLLASNVESNSKSTLFRYYIYSYENGGNLTTINYTMYLRKEFTKGINNSGLDQYILHKGKHVVIFVPFEREHQL